MAFQRCTRCIMDNRSDSTIRFDAQGRCNYCTDALTQKARVYFPNEEGQRRLDIMLQKVREEGRGKPYDCVIGLSGGLDSCYLTYLAHQWGLRILAVHIDDGYDTEISKSNIKKLCDAAQLDLRIVKPDQVQYDALIRAYMEAGVPNLAVAQDNLLLAPLYKLVLKNHVKYLLSGGNFALECILQHDNVYNSMDTVNIHDIHRRFGSEKIDKLHFTSSYGKFLRTKLGLVISLRPLDLIDYNRDRAFAELADFCGFQYYGQKHLENILTAFVQLYWFPKKFGVDKRTSHLSSMIISDQMTREVALKELEEPLYDETMMDEYIAIIKKRLKLSDADFDRIMAAPTHQHTDYKTDKASVFIRKLFFSHSDGDSENMPSSASGHIARNCPPPKDS